MEQLQRKSLEDQANEQVEAIYLETLKLPEVKEALDILDGLPEHLKYHDKNHTLDVIKETILFSVTDWANSETIREQCIAAAWHDVGYIKQDKDNETIAVEMFKGSLTYKSLPEDAKERIVSDILDTQIKMIDNAPHLNKEQSSYGYILDADVSNFGRDDYFEKGRSLAEELGLDLDNLETKKKFYAFAIALLENHEWKTDSARNLRQAKKEENMIRMKEELTALASD